MRGRAPTCSCGLTCLADYLPPPGQVRGTWRPRRGGQGTWQIPRAPFPSLAPGHPALLGAWPRNRAFLEEEDWLAGSAAGPQQDRPRVCEPAAWAQRSLHFPIPTGSPHRPPEQARLGWAWLPLPAQHKSGTHRPLSQGQTRGSDLGSQNPRWVGGWCSALTCSGDVCGLTGHPAISHGHAHAHAPRAVHKSPCPCAHHTRPHPWGQTLCAPRSPPLPAFTEGCAPLVVPTCSPTGQGVTELHSLGGRSRGSLGECEPARPPSRNTGEVRGHLWLS